MFMTYEQAISLAKTEEKVTMLEGVRRENALRSLVSLRRRRNNIINDSKGLQTARGSHLYYEARSGASEGKKKKVDEVGERIKRAQKPVEEYLDHRNTDEVALDNSILELQAILHPTEYQAYMRICTEIGELGKQRANYEKNNTVYDRVAMQNEINRLYAKQYKKMMELIEEL